MLRSDVKNGDILFVVWGVKPNVKKACVRIEFHKSSYFEGEWGSHYTSLNSKCHFNYIRDETLDKDYVVVPVDDIFEDWGQLYMQRADTYCGIAQYFIMDINPCDRCKHRLARLCGNCPGIFESKE